MLTVYWELPYPKNQKMYDPILVTLLKMWPHDSQSSRGNATPSSGTSPVASYKEAPPGALCRRTCIPDPRERETAYKNLVRPLIMKVPHEIPMSRRTFKTWRKLRERQRDYARTTTTLGLAWQECCRNLTGKPQPLVATSRKTVRLSFMCKLSHNLTDFSVEAGEWAPGRSLPKTK